MEKYEFLNRTGEGAYGSVWRARDKNTGLLVAVKKMKDVPQNDEEGEIAMREVRVLQLAKHVNVVNLLEAYRSQSGRLYLVFEYVERTLLQELKANRGGMPPAAVKSITWQLLQALGYLHRKQIIHRDVKPSNVLLTEGGVVKICDFGFARACADGSDDPAYTTYVVTRWYRPPEVLVGDTYGPPVDIWALGCIFAEMLAGRPLFPGKNHHDQLWLILKCVGRMTERQLHLLDTDPQFACFRLPTQSELEPLDVRLAGVSPAAMQVLRACLDPDPKQRASAEELLALPYFDGVTKALPLEDLAAYPDPDMRDRLDRTLAHDQATAATAAAAREVALARPQGKPQFAALTTSEPNEASPQRQQQPQQLPGGKPPGGVPPLPCKAATGLRLDPHVDIPRPPLQRHITAPPSSLASKILAAPPSLAPLVMEVYGGGYPLQSQGQRSHSSSDGSRQNSPGAHTGGERGLGLGQGLGLGAGGTGLPPAPLVPPVRGRPSWRFSGDGSYEGASAGSQQQQPHGARGPSLSVPSVLSGCNHAPGSEAVGKHASEHSSVAVRPPHHRTTWNGSSGSRSNTCTGFVAAGGNGNASGGAGGIAAGVAGSSSGAACGGASAAAPPSLAAVTHKPALEAVMLHRKSHSLAGNEALLPAAASAPLGIRGPPAGGGHIAGLHGRSLAPPLGQVHGTTSCSSSAPSGAGFQPPPQPQSQGLLATSAIPHRLTPSPPPGGYAGGLRPSNGTGQLGGGMSGRATHDGAGPAYLYPLQSQLACVYGVPFSKQPAPPQQQQQQQQLHLTHQVQPTPAAGGGASVGEPTTGAELDVEVSDSNMADGGAAHNDGRRASDTVLYAAIALREAKYRVEKAAHIIAVPSKPQLGLLESNGCGNGGGIGSASGLVGNGQGLGVLRVQSFGRTSATSNGPPSPDASAPSPPNLPPLQGTPQRRLSTSEGSCLAPNGGGGGSGGLAVASGGAAAGTATSHGHSLSNGRAPPGVAPHPPNGGAGGSVFAQRLAYHKFPLQGQGLGQGSLKGQGVSGSGLQPTPSVDPVEMGDCGFSAAGASAQVILPTLEPGAYSGKGLRAGSASVGPALPVARRPSKGTLRSLGPDAPSCKREEAAKSVLLEAVPEASVL